MCKFELRYCFQLTNLLLYDKISVLSNLSKCLGVKVLNTSELFKRKTILNCKARNIQITGIKNTVFCKEEYIKELLLLLYAI